MQSIYNAEPTKVVVVMVGLPARGKSYISKKIYRFLNWLGFRTQVYNVGNYRRKYMIDNNMDLTEDFFNPDIKQYQQLRQQICIRALEDVIQFINEPENIVAILDATNTTKVRRKMIAQYLSKGIKQKYEIVFIQSICNDKNIVQNNIKTVKVHGLDFAHQQEDQATQNFLKRIEQYQKKYEHVSQQQGYPYLKTINVGQGFEVHNIHGYLCQKIMTYVMNLTISPQRIIYLTRHGQSLYNLDQRIGGDPKLSLDGEKFAQALPFVLQQLIQTEQQRQKTRIITSTLVRTQQTAKYIKINKSPIISLKPLDQLNAGICQHLTYDQIKFKHPDIHQQRSKQKLKYRYPSGQSYLDVIGRLQPVIYWLQRQKYPVLVIGHQASLRCLSAYFFNIDLEKVPYIDVPLHTLVKMTPQTYSFREQYVTVDIQNKCIQSIMRPQRKKYSIDQDGSRIKSIHSLNKINSV